METINITHTQPLKCGRCGLYVQIDVALEAAVEASTFDGFALVDWVCKCTYKNTSPIAIEKGYVV